MRPGLLDAIRDRPLLLDGAMGTRLMARGLDLGSDDPSLWNLSRPEAVASIHTLDVGAGSDAILTNTFGANDAWLDRLGRSPDMAGINRRAVALARDADGRARYVLGSIGPTASWREGAYRSQADALADAGVDGLFLETHDASQALDALRALRGSTPLPILVGLRATPSDDEFRSIVGLGVDAVGLNCVGPHEALDWLSTLPGPVGVPLLTKPSASHPEAEIAISPAGLAALVPDLLREGARLLGGCCGSDERHIAAMRAALDAERARGV